MRPRSKSANSEREIAEDDTATKDPTVDLSQVGFGRYYGKYGPDATDDVTSILSIARSCLTVTRDFLPQ